MANESSLLEPSEEILPYWHPDFELVACKTMREYIIVVLSHLVYGNYQLEQSQQTNILCDFISTQNAFLLPSLSSLILLTLKAQGYLLNYFIIKFKWIKSN